MGLRGNPHSTPPQWCLDQAEALTNDIMGHADANHNGVLDRSRVQSATVAPLLYEEMRSQGFQAPRV